MISQSNIKFLFPIIWFQAIIQRGGIKAEPEKLFEVMWEYREIEVVQIWKTQYKQEGAIQRENSRDLQKAILKYSTQYCEEITWGWGKKHTKWLKVTYSNALKGINNLLLPGTLERTLSRVHRRVIYQ